MTRHNSSNCAAQNFSLSEVARKGPRPRSRLDLALHILERSKPGPGGCLLWPGAKTKGYGMVLARAWHPINPQFVHRVVFEVFKGAIPAGFDVSHLCHVPLCVNPTHLIAESHAANMARIPAAKRGRRTHYPVELIAKRIEKDRSVWGVVVDYGISYSHACRIRAGWRPRDVT